MDQVLQRENLLRAYDRVVGNGGAPGIDGQSVEDLGELCRQHWPAIKAKLLSGTYRPQPVRRVEIPKPDGQGVRMLGIPTVLDRLIQQALLQVMTPIFDPTFSDASYGFRPGRSAHQAVVRARQHMAEGYRWVVDMDLEKFFDRVNHDILMARVARKVKDKRVLKLIRRYLQAGIMEGGVVSPRSEGTPQGGPLALVSKLRCKPRPDAAFIVKRVLPQDAVVVCRFASAPCHREHSEQIDLSSEQNPSAILLLDTVGQLVS